MIPLPIQNDATTSQSSTLDLLDFFPYQVAVFSHEVSRAIANLYTGEFQLSRQEWRVLAALGQHQQMSAKEIAEYSTLEKMQVSRAINNLVKRALVSREEDQHDRRHIQLRLTQEGQDLYAQLVPRVLSKEQALLSSLSDEEIATFKHTMQKIQQHAQNLSTTEAK